MDHPFLVGKSLFDMGESDLRELWAAEIQPHEYNDVDWSAVESALQPKSQVVLNDKLMSEALVSSDVPVKEEHSYCSQLDTVCSSPLHSDLVRSDDEDDLLSTVDCQNIDSPCVEDAVVVVEAEPFIEPCSPISSCPSPTLKISRRNYNSSYDSDSKSNSKSLEKIDKKPSSSLTTGKTGGGKRKRPISVYTSPHVNVPASHPRFPLPPTPPSCASSDNEGNVSPLYPSLPTPNVFTLAATTTRQPIHTSLISNQPKGSTGVLSLTEEEKRTLIAEGYPIPSSLPLTKAEEKCLKKIRRKIKNKISAQESRRKKKEYVDTLEKKVQFLSSENNMFRRRIHHLESNNTDLSLELTQMKRCRSMLEAQNSQH